MRDVPHATISFGGGEWHLHPAEASENSWSSDYNSLTEVTLSVSP
jgi:hypothetical protein